MGEEKKVKMKKARLLAYSVFLCLLISRQVFGNTNAYFGDKAFLFGNDFSTGDWTRPSSEITSSETLLDSLVFSVDYLASDNALDYVELWYSYNYGVWQHFGNDIPSSPGSFSFASPEGDGYYRFITVAVDESGHVEDKNGNDIDDNLELDAVSWFLGASVYEVQVDASVPYTVLSLDEFGDDWLGGSRFATSELTANGNFEDELDSESNWIWGGDGDHRTVSDLEEDTRGENSGMVGWFDNDPLSGGIDSLYQLVSLPATSSPTLSFWYRVVSNDIVDYDWFEAKIVNDSNPSGEEVIIRTGSDEVGGWSGDSFWREVSHSLSRWAGETIKILFSVVNGDEPGFILNTYALVDDVRITISDNFVTSDKEIALVSSDAGSGVDETYYQVNDGGWQLSDGDITLAEEGVSSESAAKIDYYSVDFAGNVEATRSLEVRVDDSKDYFSVVINQFMANPIGDEASPADLLDSEWIELYNNGDSDIDVAGWVISDGILSDLHPQLITTAMTEFGSTIVPAHDSLRIYANFYLNNSEDMVKLYRNPGGQLVDSYRYPYCFEGKTWKRDPDGVGAWSDPELKNDLEANIVALGGNKLRLTLINLPTKQVDYELTYLSSAIEKGISGQVLPEKIINGSTELELYLGTCSSGGICVADALDDNLINLTLKVDDEVLLNKEEYRL